MSKKDFSENQMTERDKIEEFDRRLAAVVDGLHSDLKAACAERDQLRLALQEAQREAHEVERLKYENNEAATAIEGFGEQLAVSLASNNLLKRQVDQQQTVIQELAEALRESLQLGNLTLMSEERSSAHYHGPKAADKYAEKALALENKIRAALQAAAPWLRTKEEQ